jgi:hypothetical protein
VDEISKINQRLNGETATDSFDWSILDTPIEP